MAKILTQLQQQISTHIQPLLNRKGEIKILIDDIYIAADTGLAS